MQKAELKPGCVAAQPKSITAAQQRPPYQVRVFGVVRV
jgi:hypothetical protein